jgi:hypothetical protein
MGMFDDLIPQKGAPSAPPKGMFDDLIPKKEPPNPIAPPTGNSDSSFASMSPDDIYGIGLGGMTRQELAPSIAGGGRAIVGGINQAATGLAGLPADVGRLAQTGVDYGQSRVQGRPFEEVRAENAKRAVISPETLQRYGGEALEKASPLYYEPQSTTERYLKSGVNFAASGAAGPGSLSGRLLRNAVGYGLVPGAASEAAGQLAEQAGASPAAQAVTRGVAALGGGLATGLATAPSRTVRNFQEAVRNSTPQQRDLAETLYQEANQRGLPLTRFNAIDAVTQGATNLSDIQRVMEGHGQLRGFFAPTAEGVQREGRSVLDTVAPVNNAPSGIGPAVGQAAERTIGDVTGRINATTRPLYQQAGQARVGVPIHQGLTSDPIYADTLREIRSNPRLNATIANLPDDSVAVLDLVQRRLRERAENVSVPGQATTSNLEAGNLRDTRAATIAAADTATGSRPGVAGTYEQARNAQAGLRRQFLEPLMNGPLGRLQNEPTTQQAIEVLFPRNPGVANSADEVRTAVDQVARRSPQAARDLVRAHMESVLNEAQRARGTAGEFAGPRAEIGLRGNPEQASRLTAALEASAGPDVAAGVNRLLDIFEAQGYRQGVGSRTSFNTAGQSDLRRGTPLAEIGEAAMTGGIKLPGMIQQAIHRWRTGSNLELLSNLATNPRYAGMFRQLATETNEARTAQLVSRLVGLGVRGATSRSTPAPERR